MAINPLQINQQPSGYTGMGPVPQAWQPGALLGTAGAGGAAGGAGGAAGAGGTTGTDYGTGWNAGGVTPAGGPMDAGAGLGANGLGDILGSLRNGPASNQVGQAGGNTIVYMPSGNSWDPGYGRPPTMTQGQYPDSTTYTPQGMSPYDAAAISQQAAAWAQMQGQLGASANQMQGQIGAAEQAKQGTIGAAEQAKQGSMYGADQTLKGVGLTTEAQKAIADLQKQQALGVAGIGLEGTKDTNAAQFGLGQLGLAGQLGQAGLGLEGTKYTQDANKSIAQTNAEAALNVANAQNVPAMAKLDYLKSLGLGNFISGLGDTLNNAFAGGAGGAGGGGGGIDVTGGGAPSAQAPGLPSSTRLINKAVGGLRKAGATAVNNLRQSMANRGFAAGPATGSIGEAAMEQRLGQLEPKYQEEQLRAEFPLQYAQAQAAIGLPYAQLGSQNYNAAQNRGTQLALGAMGARNSLLNTLFGGTMNMIGGLG